MLHSPFLRRVKGYGLPHQELLQIGKPWRRTRGDVCLSLSCHLQKTWHSLSRLSQSCFGRRGHLQKLYCWHPGLVVLRGMTHQGMNSPVGSASNSYFCCVSWMFVFVWSPLGWVTGACLGRNSAWTVGGVSHSAWMHWIWTIPAGSLASHPWGGAVPKALSGWRRGWCGLEEEEELPAGSYLSFLIQL